MLAEAPVTGQGHEPARAVAMLDSLARRDRELQRVELAAVEIARAHDWLPTATAWTRTVCVMLSQQQLQRLS